MQVAELARAAANAAVVSLPAVAPATIPVWGPPAVELFGVNIPIASMALSMVGLAMARGVSAAREGMAPGGRYLTGVLVMILFGLVVERQPGPGVAIAWGIGVGGSGIVLYDLLRDRVVALFRGGGGIPGGPPPAT
jgi:hypothetical protein